jgi:D-alanyl-D-alanine carboxypeptidase/D-alanyl-D-alanine-endopeptidase (penicillin-binding protein 4)
MLIKLLILFLSLPLNPLYGAASLTPAQAKLKKSIEGVLTKNILGNVDAGVYAVQLPSGKPIFEMNAEKLLIPASVCKVFTAYTALKKLKPQATFKTSLYSKGPLSEGNLAGDIYLKGGGDPSFVSERLWMMVNEMKRSGITTVSGNLIADASYFDTETHPESRPKYLKDQAYNAPIGALSFNFNTTTIYVKPGEKPGSAPIVYTDPENSYIDVVNQAQTVKAGSANTVNVSRTDYVKGDIGDTVLLRGKIPTDAKEMRFYRNIVNPTLYTANIFKSFMEQRGLKIQGAVKEGVTPPDAKLVLEFESLPIWQVIWGMNKFSNNFVADQILKKVGAEMWGPPGSREKGITTLNQVLEDIGIPKNSYSIQDGSGLTRQTRVTAKQVVTVLKAAYQEFGMAPEFMASLGVAGEDGTLRKRFPSQEGWIPIRAKTGSLDGVTALAGYAESADGEPIAFAVILNDHRNKYGRMTSWTDQIATLLTKYSKN